MPVSESGFIAFEGQQRLAAGTLPYVARAVWEVMQTRPQTRVLVFDQATSELMDFDTRGTAEQVAHRLQAITPRHGAPEPSRVAGPTPDASPSSPGPGRPRLGVVAREVTQLPRHWEWLGSQPGGASVALRKLVEQAKRSSEPHDRVRRAQEASYRFMSAMAGNLAGFEDAARALFAADQPRFAGLLASWPVDVREHLMHLATPAFAGTDTQESSHV